MTSLREAFFTALTESQDVTVYRLESGVFGGPYNARTPFDVSSFIPSDYKSAQQKLWSIGKVTPPHDRYQHVPFQDVPEFDHIDWGDGNSEWFACFTSKRQLVNWFAVEDSRKAAALADATFGIAMYTVPEEYVIDSFEQAIFIKDKATLIRRLPITPDVIDLL